MTERLPWPGLIYPVGVGEDLSVEAPLATPKSYLTLSVGPEQVLVPSGGPTEHVEPCVCGGEIVVWPGESIAEAVADHQVTLRHETWRWKVGILETELRALWGDR